VLEQQAVSYILTGLLVGGSITVVGIAIAFLIGQRRLGKHRGVSREEFIRAFAATKIPTEIPAAVYDYYKSRVVSKEFSVAPDDNYEQVLCEGDEDIDDDAAFLIKKLGFKMLRDGESVQPETRVRTLRDMVHWLDKVRQHQAV
jgi:hypothetical protein